MEFVRSTLFSIASNHENTVASPEEDYTVHQLPGEWKLSVLNKRVFDMLVEKGDTEFKIEYSPDAVNGFGYIDSEMTLISLDKANRYYVKPTTDHFIGLMLGWSLVDSCGETFTDNGEKWTPVENDIWHGDIDSVILNLVMPKDGNGACGCGDNAGAVEAVGRFIESQGNHPIVTDREAIKAASRSTLYQDGLLGNSMLFIGYVLDAAGFTEHGGSVYNGWLTLKGVYLAFLIAESLSESACVNAD